METVRWRSPSRQTAPTQSRQQTLVAAADIEHERLRVVLLRVQQQDTEQERLATSRRAQHQRVAHVADVQGPVVQTRGGSVSSVRRQGASR